MRSTPDTARLWLADAKSTASAGASLAHTLHRHPVTIFLRGELGAGKTTFLQGLGSGLGVEQRLLSPTYALEQRYEGRAPVLHLDLYRLTPADAAALVASSDDFPGVRCIEWSERLERLPDGPSIDVSLAEARGGRDLHVVFRDTPLPSEEDVHAWRTMVALPKHVARHCDAVADAALRLSAELGKRAVIIRPAMLRLAALLHDLFRFVDFRPGADPPGVVIGDRDRVTHTEWKARYHGLRHEEVCARFLREKGFPELAGVIAVHGLMEPSPARLTIEEKLLFYADKRVKDDVFVTLDERFNDFRKRYGHGHESPQAKLWHDEAKAIEQELFPDGAPA